MLDNENIDAVIISLPNFLHLESAICAAEAGKDIFLEKPLARDVKEGEKIIETVKKNDVKLMVGYPLRFNKVFIDINEKINDGFFGEVHAVDASDVSHGPFSARSDSEGPSPVPSWWFSKELTGGGALIDLGSHLINLLIWNFGEVTEAKSYLGYEYNMEVEDLALGVLKFRNGPIASIRVGWFSKDFQINFKIYGSAKISSKNVMPTTFTILFNAIKTKIGKYDHDPFYQEIKYFTDCINSDIPPIPSGEDGLKDLEVISMMYNDDSLLF